jgi:hypothetical protein
VVTGRAAGSRSPRDGDIFTMSRDGTGPRQVTSDARDDRLPSWAPDGAHIAWARQDAVMGRDAISEIWIARTDGTSAPADGRSGRGVGAGVLARRHPAGLQPRAGGLL